MTQSYLYVYGENLYINLTNRCPCACTFCIREQQEGVGTAESLWLQKDPTTDQIKNEFAGYDLNQFKEVIFCGYGEPMCALQTLVEVAQYVRSISDITIRLNTNGLGDLINSKETAPLLEGLVDVVSVSLNAPDPDTYCAVTQPSFGKESYGAMLKFASDCKKLGMRVVFSVVDVISPEDIALCKQIAEEREIPLRVRSFGENA